MKKRFLILLFFLCFITGSSFTFAESPGELNKVHSRLEGMTHCVKCHTPEQKIEPLKCLECHKELALRINAKKGYHSEKGEDCAVCHQEHQGKNSQLIQWEIEEFDHRETGYPLTGSHEKVTNCDYCHTPANSLPREQSKTYLLKDSRCSACHRDVHNGNHPDCTDCHNTKDWEVDIW